MRSFRLGIVALLSALAMLVSGTAWAATYATTIEAATYNGEAFDVTISSERETAKEDLKCTAGRLVEFFQKRPNGTKKDLGNKKTNETGQIVNWLPDSQPNPELGDIFVKVTRKDITDRQICAAAVGTADLV